jgi:lysophospholipase L1-like esterase
MSNLCLLAAGLLVNGQGAEAPKPVDLPLLPDPFAEMLSPQQTVGAIATTTNNLPDPAGAHPEFSSATCQSRRATSALDTPVIPSLAVENVSLAPMLDQLPAMEGNAPADEIRSPLFRSPGSVPKAVGPSRGWEKSPWNSDALPTVRQTPASGSQMFRQRIAALRSGRLYTRISPDSYRSAWIGATAKPTYEQWKQLLAQEARALARGQGNNRLSIIVGDSLSLWFPSSQLPSNQFWLNQGISGDTTNGILKRLSAFAQTRPDTIYVLAGVNDLRRGISDGEITANLNRIVRRLRQNHPQAQVVVQSILPTGLYTISNDRIQRINQRLAAIARQEGAYYLDLYSLFVDGEGTLNRELTTDGLHLNQQGYQVWQLALNQTDTQLAALRSRRTASVSTRTTPRPVRKQTYQFQNLTIPETTTNVGWSG